MGQDRDTIQHCSGFLAEESDWQKKEEAVRLEKRKVIVTADNVTLNKDLQKCVGTKEFTKSQNKENSVQNSVVLPLPTTRSLEQIRTAMLFTIATKTDTQIGRLPLVHGL